MRLQIINNHLESLENYLQSLAVLTHHSFQFPSSVIIFIIEVLSNPIFVVKTRRTYVLRPQPESHSYILNTTHDANAHSVDIITTLIIIAMYEVHCRFNNKQRERYSCRTLNVH